MSFNGLGMNLGQLSRLSSAVSRSCSSENPTGGKGQGGRGIDPNFVAAKELGQGWKVRPYDNIEPGKSLILAEIEGSGVIQQIWMTPLGNYRHSILRFFWDGETSPSIEVPVGDFFASAFTSFDTFAPINSLAVCVNPGNAFNCYWEMPFRSHCKITLENIGTEELRVYYQINYTLTTVPEDCGYFHAQFRRSSPLEYKEVHTLVDQLQGQGHYVGTYLAWQVNNNGWWGEGEVKFYIDGDLPDGTVGKNVREHGGQYFPTICGTGTEDYFCGSYNFENKATKQYQEFSTAYAGLSHVVRPNGVYQANTRFSLYRWHIMDPVRFSTDFAVTIQALGWRSGGRYLPLQDDVSSVAFWYQREPHSRFPELPDRNGLEII